MSITNDIHDLCKRLDILHEWQDSPRDRETITLSKSTLERQAAENKRLRGVLGNLVRMNEEHNAAVEKVMGRPLNWSDNYLNEARAALTGED